MSDKAPGYRGIWFELRQRSAYGDKYSGALGTYTAKHVPMAIYSPQVNKTFFVYGGTTRADQKHLLVMIGYYDHLRDVVPRPTIVHDKQGVDDPHDNPSIAIDGDGFIWVFVSGRSKLRPGYIYRSRRPHDIDDFERVTECEITYPQPWWIPGKGFMHLFTMYTGVRELYWATSVDGRNWTSPRKLAGMEGHYQTSRLRGQRVITTFNRHRGGEADGRTDLYFVQTDDLGETWRTITGEPIATPLVDPKSSALVRDYWSERRWVYMKDIDFDARGNPVILHLSSSHYQPGPAGDPRTWTIAKWTGNAWAFHDVTTSTHNYDTGSLDLSDDSDWRIIGPSAAGPQRWGTGGEMVIWRSADRGATWCVHRQITKHSVMNHAYARRPIDAHHDFAAFWSDGDPDRMSPSRLYFTNRDGLAVRRLPYDMDGDEARPLDA